MKHSTDIEKTFFELLRVAVGNADSLSHLPSQKEWKALYYMAKKQSLVGVCFAALQRLGADADEGFARIGMSVMQYLTWMGMAAKIQQRNQIVNEQCETLQQKLSNEGLQSCILKGQAVAALYQVNDNDNCHPDSSINLQGLRQSGDIDAWVNASRKDIIKYVQMIAPTTNAREHHIELKAFQETEVEIHFWPAVIRHFLKNRKLQRWFEEHKEDVFSNRVDISSKDLESNPSNSSNFSEPLTVCAPTPEFHAIQQMAHMYHHLFDSGIGLRQVMDYYFVLKALSATPEKHKALASDIKHIGMGRFASAMMWVIKTVFVNHDDDNENFLLGIKPNEADGRFLLYEIMRGGNFGKYDNKNKRNTKHYATSFYGSIFRNMHYLRFNPFDWFWSPLWRLYYFVWRKCHGYH